MTQLAGKVAIVTGGARGVAKGIATAFVKAGASVLIVDREADLGRATEAELQALGGDVAFLAMDLADRAALPSIVSTALDRFGKLDILVNAAQASRQLPLADTTDEAMELSFDTGFWPTFTLMRAAYPHLVESRGCVINFGSGAAFDGLPTQGSYAAAKEAIRAISKVAASEWGPQGVRVNVICPFANSPGVQMWRDHAQVDYDAQIAKVALRRIGDCEKDIGAAAVFLASDAAAYITGQTLMVDGGQTKAF
ncbi:SDR family NAD(P)-dependent oxidoreductase [Sphingobium vermicomposti]|uniref:NAD(P)-dependent dehydrogenase (Short-subunit alcohol dehydrogenase family) n=1 Tax=Sphingobium vermicomposti TaxID=529005 RepID=A0A846MI18_9SPHN|nr:SDR family oxidoreductase [Sphingobium vermicomposti]NIJ18196.1 NAD(P)-dependent dehydrogenase (short-subunit alcohol dehydrogenase family) [Sphingobium vermicomposti]